MIRRSLAPGGDGKTVSVSSTSSSLATGCGVSSSLLSCDKSVARDRRSESTACRGGGGGGGGAPLGVSLLDGGGGGGGGAPLDA